MNQLIGQVLGLARGLENEPHQSVCLPDFLAELVDEFDIAHSPSMLNLSSASRVNAPPMALRRALGNLLENALRYAPPDSVLLACEVLTAGYRVGVLDRGPGIPEDKMALMLEPFQRLEVSRSPVTGGVGLGLAIVQSLAMANGWQLDMGNRPGGGLQVWLVLPA
jgi:two-component system osmolarity sensor histidine kinase EnvZ